jgi:hypothetical protein
MALACLRTQSERQAGQARGDACIRRRGSAAGPAAAAGTASGGGRSAPDRRGGATAASRGRVAAARRPGSGTATSRGGCPARRGPAASAIGVAAGNAYRLGAAAGCCSDAAKAAGLPGWAVATAASPRQVGQLGAGPAGTYQCRCVTVSTSQDFTACDLKHFSQYFLLAYSCLASELLCHKQFLPVSLKRLTFVLLQVAVPSWLVPAGQVLRRCHGGHHGQCGTWWTSTPKWQVEALGQ